MNLPDRFLVEGMVFGRKELLRHALLHSVAGDNPVWRKKVFAFIADFLDTEQSALEQQTSGTTGEPKKIVLDRGAMLASARRTLKYFGLEPGHKALLCLPVDYIAGKMMVVRALTGGLDLVLAEPSGLPFLEMEEEVVDFTAVVPLQLYNSLKAGEDLSRIRKLLCGGGELSANLRGSLKELEQPLIFESFGMTETYTHIAIRQINGERPDTSFRALEGVELFLDGEGCLIIRDQCFQGGEIRTRDLAELDDDGLGFTWLGRADNVIKSGGIRIIPELLEQQIGNILGRSCLVLPEKDERLGQQLLLVVEQPQEESGQAAGSTPGSIRDLLKEHLPAFEMPRRVLFTQEIPRNESMKPDRLKSLELFCR